MGTKSKILLVDDEEDILIILKYNLEKEGFEVATSSNGLECLEKVKTFIPDIILLDVMMPEMDGMETCVALRKLPALDQSIICFLTARTEDYSQIAGFDSGADDYILKPVKPKLLISKLNALLRRKPTNQSKHEEANQSGITIDREKYIVIVDGVEITLPKKEFKLLDLLASKKDVVFDRETILNTIWGQSIVVGDRTIDVHIRKLREKIGSKYIKTVTGVGYKFVSED